MTEADLGMFSMFGQTWAPTKRGHHKRIGKFFQHSSMPEIIDVTMLLRNIQQMSDNLNNFVALNSSYSTPSFLCAYIYAMRVLNKMSMTTSLSLCVLYEFSRAVFVYKGAAPHFF